MLMLKLMLNISAAFDTLDVEIQIKNLAIYGFTETTRNWYQSFLTGHSSIVKIGSHQSKIANLESGVPQGGILSPLIHIIFVSDLAFHSLASTYADDTETELKYYSHCVFT